MAAFWTLAATALETIIQVVLIILCGFLLARAGYFDTAKQKWLSKLNLVFFTPCLLFVSMGSVISWDKFISLWPIPVFYFIFASISWLVARAGSHIFQFSEAQSRFVTAAITFSNTNSLPIAMIHSLAMSRAGEVLFWEADDTKESVTARGLSYILFFGIFSNILRWSYGYGLLSKRSQEVFDVESRGLINSHRNHAYAPKSETNDSSPSDSGSDHYDSSPPQTPRPADEHSALLAFPRFPHDSDDRAENSRLSGFYIALVSAAKRVHKRIPPPLYAAFLALVVGLTPPLKHLFFDPSSFIHSSLTASITACGSVAVPIVLICLGAQMDDFSVSTSQQRTTVPVMFVVSARMLFTPFYVIPLVAAFAILVQGTVAIASDPAFLLVLIVVGCAPTAINLMQICQVNGIFEEEMTRVLFWSYGVVTIPVATTVVMTALIVVQMIA